MAVFDQPHSKERLFCLFVFVVVILFLFKWNLLYFSLCPLPFVCSLAIGEEGLTLTFSFLPLRCLYRWIRPPLSLLLFRLDSLSSLSLSLYMTDASVPLLYWWTLTHSSMPMSFLHWGALEPAGSVEKKRRMTSPSLLPSLLPVQPRRLLVFFALRVPSLTHGQPG